jgi:hypothetical protein
MSLAWINELIIKSHYLLISDRLHAFDGPLFGRLRHLSEFGSNLITRLENTMNAFDVRPLGGELIARSREGLWIRYQRKRRAPKSGRHGFGLPKPIKSCRCDGQLL